MFLKVTKIGKKKQEIKTRNKNSKIIKEKKIY